VISATLKFIHNKFAKPTVKCQPLPAQTNPMTQDSLRGFLPWVDTTVVEEVDLMEEANGFIAKKQFQAAAKVMAAHIKVSSDDIPAFRKLLTLHFCLRQETGYADTLLTFSQNHPGHALLQEAVQKGLHRFTRNSILERLSTHPG